jgi:hypothetical protein
MSDYSISVPSGPKIKLCCRFWHAGRNLRAYRDFSFGGPWGHQAPAVTSRSACKDKP